MNASKLYISQKQASVLLGLPMKHIHKMADEGRVRFTVTPGGHRRYLKSDLMRLLDVGTKLALYVPFGAKLRGEIESVLDCCKNSELKIHVVVIEQDKDVAKALPDRQGFKQILDMARNREIMGFLFVSDITPKIIPNDGLTLSWLVSCARLGLYCYKMDFDTIEPYPYRIL